MKILVFLIIIFSFLSCSTSKRIYIKDDGSAIINTLNVFTDSTKALNSDTSFIKDKLNRRDVVTDFSFTEENSIITIHLKTADSIGNFLDPLSNGYFRFKTYSDTLLVIQTTDTFPIMNPEFKGCCSVFLEIIPDKKVINVSTKTKGVKWKKKHNKVLISLGNKQMRKGKQQLDVKIYLK